LENEKMVIDKSKDRQVLKILEKLLLNIKRSIGVKKE